ncbi:hypothetical protein F4819DRAFT_451330 [Hypoxylon fuscum]|nr:hypothetical protein F4819DRAFT_451330 [Hypoxylon fuscum]
MSSYERISKKRAASSQGRGVGSCLVFVLIVLGGLSESLGSIPISAIWLFSLSLFYRKVQKRERKVPTRMGFLLIIVRSWCCQWIRARQRVEGLPLDPAFSRYQAHWQVDRMLETVAHGCIRLLEKRVDSIHRASCGETLNAAKYLPK